MPNQPHRVECICQVCNAPFTVKASVGTKKTCSRVCKEELIRRNNPTTICPTCHTAFTAPRSNRQTYCSISCAITARNLTDQNPSYSRDITGEKNPMYGRGQAGEKNGMFGKRREQASQWKGGRKIRKDGYILIIAPDAHPYAISNGRKKQSTKYLLEHRYIMEQSLGRYLLPGEVVHHKDGNPSNNALDNLELCESQSAHISEQHTHRRPKHQP